MAFIGLEVLVGFDTVETVVMIILVVVTWVGPSLEGMYMDNQGCLMNFLSHVVTLSLPF